MTPEQIRIEALEKNVERNFHLIQEQGKLIGKFITSVSKLIDKLS